MTISSGSRSWEKTWLEVAAVVAKRSLCVRDKVGAVIVDPNNRIVSSGYNGPPQGFKHDNSPCTSWCTRPTNTNVEMAKIAFGQEFVSESPLDPCYRDCPSLHAEQNALLVCDRSTREGGTIYITSHVCAQCAKMIANSGLSTVVIKVGRTADHRGSNDWYDFLGQCGLNVRVITPIMRGPSW